MTRSRKKPPLQIPADSDGVRTVRTKVIRKHQGFLERNCVDPNIRYICSYGGAGSGKSKSVAIHFCKLALKYPKVVLGVFRKNGPSVNKTVLRDIKMFLDLWGVPYQENVTKGTITFPNKSIMYFMGLDDPHKLQSFEANSSWLEEATEFTKDDILQVRLRCRLPKIDDLINQVYMTWNPRTGFVTEEFVKAKGAMFKKAAVLHSTHRDNPYLNPADRLDILALAESSELANRIYNLGKPGVFEDIIYTNFEFIPKDKFPVEIRNKDPDRYGLDIGYNAHNALSAIWFHKGCIYVHQCLYKQYQTTPDLIAAMRQVATPNVPIYCDPSRPDVIEELNRAGFVVMEATNDIIPGINYVKSFHLIISEESEDMRKEIELYSYLKDHKSGERRELPAPKQQDHLMDSMRYGIYTDHPTDVKDIRESEFRNSFYDPKVPRIYNDTSIPIVCFDQMGLNRGGY